MDYLDIARKAKKPALKPFDTFTKFGPFSENGYVVIPDNFPIDYTDDFYQQIDTSPVTEITFSGYVTEIDGELDLFFLGHDSVPDMDKVVRAIGFDDAHGIKNEMGAKEGAEYLAEQLKKLNNEVK